MEDRRVCPERQKIGKKAEQVILLPPRTRHKHRIPHSFKQKPSRLLFVLP